MVREGQEIEKTSPFKPWETILELLIILWAVRAKPKVRNQLISQALLNIFFSGACLLHLTGGFWWDQKQENAWGQRGGGGAFWGRSGSVKAG